MLKQLRAHAFDDFTFPRIIPRARSSPDSFVPVTAGFLIKTKSKSRSPSWPKSPYMRAPWKCTPK